MLGQELDTLFNQVSYEVMQHFISSALMQIRENFSPF